MMPNFFFILPQIRLDIRRAEAKSLVLLILGRVRQDNHRVRQGE